MSQPALKSRKREEDERGRWQLRCCWSTNVPSVLRGVRRHCKLGARTRPRDSTLAHPGELHAPSQCAPPPVHPPYSPSGVKAGENPLTSNVMKLKTLRESVKVSSKTVSYSGGTKQDQEKLNSSQWMLCLQATYKLLIILPSWTLLLLVNQVLFISDLHQRSLGISRSFSLTIPFQEGRKRSAGTGKSQAWEQLTPILSSGGRVAESNAMAFKLEHLMS